MSDEHGEPPRPDPGFRVYVERPNRRHPREPNRIDVTDAVMDVYDIAVGSMDFGSGFLSTEEVGNLRALGEAIGAKRFDYQNDKCLRCGHEYIWHDGLEPESCRGAGPTPTQPRRVGDPIRECPCTGFVRPA